MKKCKILIVDDTPATVEILNEILGDEHEILCATRGEDALDVASSERPDLVLLDIIMPGMNGYEVCRRLKSDDTLKNIPVIFITAMGEEEDEAKGLEVGAIDYITKPVNKAIVRARIRNHLDLKLYRDYLEEISVLDGLTGIPNRRRFDDCLEQEWRRSIRSGRPVSLILMDIDHFKRFNDHYGHLAGDDCLKKVAYAINHIPKRATDLVARYGGEEFACVLPETGATGARTVGDQLLESVRSLQIPHIKSDVSPVVTLSLGVATHTPSAGSKRENVIAAADEMLYKAKSDGRNRMVQDEDAGDPALAKGVSDG